MAVTGVTKGRRVHIEGVEYETASAASRELGIPLPTVYTRLMSQTTAWKEWFYADGLPTSVLRGGKVKRKLFVCYVLTHIPSGMVYVGSTGHFTSRKASHLHLLRKGTHPTKALQELFQKDSEESSFKWSVLVCTSREQMFEIEQRLIDSAKEEGLLLNSSLDARSPVSFNLSSEVNRVKRLENLKNSFRRNRPIIAKRISDGMKSRWSVEGARESIRGGGNPFAKKVQVDGKTYGSVKEAQSALGINEKTIRKRANSPDFPNYSFDAW